MTQSPSRKSENPLKKVLSTLWPQSTKCLKWATTNRLQVCFSAIFRFVSFDKYVFFSSSDLIHIIDARQCEVEKLQQQIAQHTSELALRQMSLCSEPTAPKIGELVASSEQQAAFKNLRLIGYELKNFQLQAVSATLRGLDCLVIAPTGSGKSLTFQLPGVWSGLSVASLTIVVSPLRALIVDQVTSLNAKVPSIAIHTPFADNNDDNKHANEAYRKTPLRGKFGKGFNKKRSNSFTQHLSTS